VISETGRKTRRQEGKKGRNEKRKGSIMPTKKKTKTNQNETYYGHVLVQNPRKGIDVVQLETKIR
jgi:hypothetical protein